MNTPIATLGALLLVAGLAAPAAGLQPAAAAEAGPEECQFITLTPFPPFVVIDWDCPPVGTPAGVAPAESKTPPRNHAA